LPEVVGPRFYASAVAAVRASHDGDRVARPELAALLDYLDDS
jgi:hypothetical protein